MTLSRVLSIVALILAFNACQSSETNSTNTPQNNTAACSAAPYTVAGPYTAGVTTVLVNGNPVEIWYPAPKGTEAGLEQDSYDMRDWLPAESASQIPEEVAPIHVTQAYRNLYPAENGPFPALVFSHGLGSFRMQSTFLTTHLATWGFIVAAPEHPERGLKGILEGSGPGDNSVTQMKDALNYLIQQNTTPGAVFEGLIDTNRTAALGHSAGGAAVSTLAGDGTVDAWVTLGSAGFGSIDNGSGLVFGGSNDGFATPELVSSNYEKCGAKPKTYVSIEGAGHLAFTDLCVIGEEDGGAIAIAQKYGLDVPDLIVQLAQDGCRDTDLDVELAWPIINHYVTAQLRFALGLDGAAIGLFQNSTQCFSGKIADFQQDNGQTNQTPGSTGDIITTLQGEGRFNTLLAALDAAGLTNTFKGADYYTLFAPNDTAFDALGSEVIAALLGDIPTLTQILLTHVTEGSKPFGFLLTTGPVPSLQGEALSFTNSTVNQVPVANKDIAATNGFVQEISGVILPSNINIEDLLGPATPPSTNPPADPPNDPANDPSNPSDPTTPEPEDPPQDPAPEDPKPEDPPVDNGVDPEAGVVNCGDVICDINSKVCCIGLSGSTCEDSCGLFSAAQKCDGPEDCGVGQICCVGFPSGATCTDSNQCPGNQEELCHEDADCADGFQCTPCSFPGSPPTDVCKLDGC